MCSFRSRVLIRALYNTFLQLRYPDPSVNGFSNIVLLVPPFLDINVPFMFSFVVKFDITR